MAARIELNLPDLPEVPISLGAQPPPERRRAPRPRPPWPTRLRDALTSYLPLLLMVLLALGSWWLVKNSPAPATPRGAKPAGGEPDYTMRGFTIQRYAADGLLQLTLEGRELHHYPQSDRIEIEELQLTANGPDGRQTLATARKAVSDGKGSRVQLLGGAQVRGRTADGQRVEVDSEFLELETESQRVRTDRPVQLRVGTTAATAGGLVWDNRQRQLELQPPIRAVLQPRSPAAEGSPR
ncbi:MAG: LPS export ABC transporter periplasmic protein LptC [Rubrivivax sp.]|nr:LPS export ABC transporter periplasmic protein LptC [Rubrivivax sp.]